MKYPLLLAAILLLTSQIIRANLVTTGSVTDLDGNAWPQTGSLAVGFSSDASVLLDDYLDGNGITTFGSTPIYVAYGEGVTGNLTVCGSGAVLRLGSPGHIYVGQGINSHGRFTLKGGTGLAYPDYENHNIYLGLGAGSYAEMLVTDPGTLLHLTDWLLVGYLSGTRGRLVVEDGAVCEASRIFIGYQAGSFGEAVVSGTNSILKGWLNESDSVGWSGRGSLVIRNGGLGEFRALQIGRVNGSHGEVLVTGNGSRLENLSAMAFGHDGNAEGILKIARGGYVYCEGDCVLGNTGAGKGTLVFIIGDDGTGSIVPGLTKINDTLRLTNAFLQMEVDAGVSLSLGQQFTLVDYLTLHEWDGIHDKFQGIPEGGIVFTPNHHAFRINYATDIGSGNLAITATVVAPPTTDADGDNLLDAWEIRCFGATDAPLSHPSLDPDGDGSSTACEHEAGTNPLDPHSRYHSSLETTATGSTWDLAYTPYDQAVTYTVERSADLSDPWDPVTPISSTVNGNTVVFTLPANNTDEGYYRVRIDR